MPKMMSSLVAVLSAVWVVGSVGVAEAQSPPTMVWDPATRVLNVQVNGMIARLIIPRGGGLLTSNAACTGCAGTPFASSTSIARIVVQGGPLNDTVLFAGNFEPGFPAETDGGSEIEMDVDLGAGTNTVQLTTGNGFTAFDAAIFTASSIDLYGDGDQDVTLAGPDKVLVVGGLQDDVFDASLYPGKVTLQGGPGDDIIIGGPAVDSLEGGDGTDLLEGGEGNDRIDGGFGDDVLLGQGGNDTLVDDFTGNDHLEGGPGNDKLSAGPGDDVVLGQDGNDTFVSLSSIGQGPLEQDGADQMEGGAGTDTMTYAVRRSHVPVVVTLDDVANDGGTGEGDNVASDIENVIGSLGPDTLVGSAVKNKLQGGPGDDEIFGEGGNDTVEGQDGNDYLEGGLDPNTLRGGLGNDILVGGPSGVDTFFGDDGDDEIVGNTDGRKEKVNCGAGLDSAEGNAEDVFTDCETLLLAGLASPRLPLGLLGGPLPGGRGLGERLGGRVEEGLGPDRRARGVLHP